MVGSEAFVKAAEAAATASQVWEEPAVTDTEAGEIEQQRGDPCQSPLTGIRLRRYHGGSLPP